MNVQIEYKTKNIVTYKNYSTDQNKSIQDYLRILNGFLFCYHKVFSLKRTKKSCNSRLAHVIKYIIIAIWNKITLIVFWTKNLLKLLLKDWKDDLNFFFVYQ